MISLVDSPGKISFAENENCWRFLADNLVEGFAAFPTIILSQVHLIQEGAIFDVSFECDEIEYQLDFTFENEPDFSGTELPVCAQGQQIDCAKIVLKYLLGNPVMNDFFTGTVNENGDVTLTFCECKSINLSVNSSFTTLFSDGNVVANNSSELIFYLCVENEFCSDDFGKNIATICKCPTAEKGKSSTEIDLYLEKYLEPLLRRANNIPSIPKQFCDGVAWADLTTVKRYILKYKQIVNSQSSFVFCSEPKTIVTGGLDYINNRESNDFFAQLSLTKKILSNLPNKRFVTCIQHNYLSIISWDENTTEIKYNINLTYSSGTSLNFNVPVLDKVKHCGKYHIPIGVPQLPNLGAVPLSNYEITFVDQNNNPISETIVFCVIPHTKETCYFLYENSLGGWDSVSFCGPKKVSVEVKKDTINKVAKTKLNEKNGQIFNQQTTSNVQYSLTTTVKEDCNNLWLEELYISEFVLQAVYCDCSKCPSAKDGYYMPITIDGGVLNLDESNVLNDLVTINYKQGWIDHKYSPKYCGCNESAGLKVSYEIEGDADNTLICVSIAADDQLDNASTITNEVTEITTDGGLTWISISLPYQNCFNRDNLNGAVIARRTIETDNPKCLIPLSVSEGVYGDGFDPNECVFVDPDWSIQDDCITLENSADFQNVQVWDGQQWNNSNTDCIDDFVVDGEVYLDNTFGTTTGFININAQGNNVNITGFASDSTEICSQSPDFTSFNYTIGPLGGHLLPFSANGNPSECRAYRFVVTDYKLGCSYIVHFYVPPGSLPQAQFENLAIVEIDDSDLQNCIKQCFFKITDCGQTKYFRFFEGSVTDVSANDVPNNTD